jgi:hypothetical protein
MSRPRLPGSGRLDRPLGGETMKKYKGHPIYGIAVPAPGHRWCSRGLVFDTDLTQTIEIKRIQSAAGLDTYLGNVEQNDSRKIYRAKTPSTQRKIITYFSEPWRPLRLCARRVFPISISSENFKYLWLVFKGKQEAEEHGLKLCRDWIDEQTPAAS